MPHRPRLVAVLLATVLVAAGCATMPRPEGPEPLRYRDTVFSEVTVSRDLVYGEAPGADGRPEALRLDLYEPTGDKVAARPVLIWAHGGSFRAGDKASGLAPVMAAAFARRGYVALSINYRLLADRSCSAATVGAAGCTNAAVEATHDGQAAVRWVRAHAGELRLDGDRIGFGGESAGAIMATAVGLTADQPGTSGNPGYPSDVRAWFSLSGGLPGGIYASAGDAPGELVSGTADPLVPYRWSVDTAAALHRAGVFVVLKTLPGAGHVPVADHGAEIADQADYFFYDLLDLGRAPR